MTGLKPKIRDDQTSHGRDLPFQEIAAWRCIGAGWKQLFGSFARLGVSFEWHDFEAGEELDWGKSFHPESLEICLNLSGTGRVSVGKQEAVYEPHTAGFYLQGTTALGGMRTAGERHQFITVEYSLEFLRRHFADHKVGLHPLITSVLAKNVILSGLSFPQRLTSEQQQLIQGLRNPPVFEAAQRLWYQSKALELAAFFFFQARPDDEFFCERQKRMAQDRVDKVIALLRENLAEPPALEELGKKVGCSHFYLSRTFSKETGLTIPQYVRQLRMERAAELLRGGKYNVTQAALEVGYNSLSHFSTAFHQTFGCCPGLYGIAPAHNEG